jgi:hypothetical protein
MHETDRLLDGGWERWDDPRRVDAAIIIALIALAGSLVSTVATVFGAPALQARREARLKLESYREPLLASAYELQARLHNILCDRFLENFLFDEEGVKQSAALESTLYVFAQFFGWREIIRREIQFLRFPRDAETRATAQLMLGIAETFLSNEYGNQFMIWRVEQRGLGERMITMAGDQPRCMGYAEFIDKRATMSEWLDPLERDLNNLEDDGRRRLRELQHQLLDLVNRLDPDHMRYPFELQKA